MRIKKTFILVFCLLVIGINLRHLPIKAQPKLSVINSKTELRRGETGIITIRGKANTNYTINTSYVLGNREIAVTQMRESDENGEATFNWVVNRRTVLGSHKAVITGGGETIEVTHTVIE